MKKRENETETYKPINKTLILVLLEAALIRREAPQLVWKPSPRISTLSGMGKVQVFIISLLFSLLLKLLVI